MINTFRIPSHAFHSSQITHGPVTTKESPSGFVRILVWEYRSNHVLSTFMVIISCMRLFVARVLVVNERQLRNVREEREESVRIRSQGSFTLGR